MKYKTLDIRYSLLDILQFIEQLLIIWSIFEEFQSVTTYQSPITDYLPYHPEIYSDPSRVVQPAGGYLPDRLHCG